MGRKIDIVSDVTGKVWKVEAPVDTEVGAGDAIIILESMKMEIPVEAPQAGRVVELLVDVEDAVEEGAKVAVLETLS